MSSRAPDFDRFVNRETDGLVRTAYLITWDLHAAEDLVQETLIKVAKRWPKVRRMDRPLAYARRILVNEALDGSKRRARARAELAAAMSPAPAAEPHAVEAHDFGTYDELIRALGTLPPRQRAVLVLRYFLDLPETEVAAALKCSLGTVKSTASRGLARLEQTLRHSNDDTRSIA
jgi:RNA polymerase sigma-70 factor (sigma-E family)